MGGTRIRLAIDKRLRLADDASPDHIIVSHGPSVAGLHDMGVAVVDDADAGYGRPNRQTSERSQRNRN